MKATTVFKNRSRLELIAQILGVAHEGILKTHIMWTVGLSYDMLKEYVDFLLAMGLLEKTGDKLKTSQKGNDYLLHYEAILKLTLASMPMVVA